jgi:DNA end-binding protein Ku
MRVAVNAHLSFGLVNVPVGVSPSTNRQPDVKFNLLHAKCEGPIKQAKYCPACEASHDHDVGLVEELSPDDLVRGYEITKGKFLTFTEGELTKMMPERSPIIELKSFVGERYAPMLKSLESNSYWLIPNDQFMTAYSMLRDAMQATHLAGIGKCCLWGKEHACYVHESADVLMLSMLLNPNDLISPDFVAPAAPKEPVSLASKLLKSMEPKTLKLSEYMPKRNEELNDLIQAKLSGMTIDSEPEPEVETTFDLMAALRASMEAEQPKLVSVKKVGSRKKVA